MAQCRKEPPRAQGERPGESQGRGSDDREREGLDGPRGSTSSRQRDLLLDRLKWTSQKEKPLPINPDHRIKSASHLLTGGTPFLRRSELMAKHMKLVGVACAIL